MASGKSTVARGASPPVAVAAALVLLATMFLATVVDARPLLTADVVIRRTLPQKTIPPSGPSDGTSADWPPLSTARGMVGKALPPPKIIPPSGPSNGSSDDYSPPVKVVSNSNSDESPPPPPPNPM